MDASAGMGKLLDVLRLSATPALAVAFASGLLLFTGDNLVGALGLTEMIDSWRAWVGVAFLGSSSLLFAYVVAAVGRWAKKRWRWWAGARVNKKRLNNLGADEREVLSRFLLERRKCLAFPLSDGVSQGLAAAGILYRSSNVGYHDAWDFSMQPWAWQYLNKNPGLVIHDAETLKLFVERTVAVDFEDFDDGRAPWDGERRDHRRGGGSWRSSM